MNRFLSVLGIAAVVMTGCAGDDMTSSDPDGGDIDNPGDGGVTGDVSVRNDFFDPTPITRSAGSAVVWAWNSGGRAHNVTFEDGQDNSPTQGSGSHSRAFPTAGTFRYRCTIHSTDFESGMVGSVEVQ